MREVPKGWLEVELADVWHESRGRARPNAIALTEYIGLEHVESGTNRILAKGRSDDVKSAVAVFAAGDVLYGRLRPYLNKVIRPTFAGVASTEFLVFKETQALANAFLMHLLSSSDLVGYANANSAGVNLPRVSAKWLAKYRFLLAPLPEQHRIVARIESLFARLDAGIAALKRAEANLERYWASVLKAAVEGRFTERWRRENPPEETGEELLQRILAERRKRWEAEQLANFEARGRKPPRNWKAKYREPVAPDTNGLPGLPVGWCWASFEALCHIQLGKMLSRRAREGRENRRPYLRNSNVRWFSIDSTDLKSMSFKASELEKFAVRPGDLLVCEGGEPGRCSVYGGPGDVLMYQKALHRARPHSDEVSTDFLQYCLAHQVAHGIGMPRYSETTIRHLTLEKIKAVPLPLAPANEQRRIARMVTAQRELTDHASGTITMSQRNAFALRQSVLKRAFEGRLVPQDLADEPASVLLERRAEREAERKRRKRRPANPIRQHESRVP